MRLLRLAILALIFAVPAVAGPAVTPLVSADWLRTNLGEPGLRIIDIRGDLSAFEAAHVPGSVRSDYWGEWHTQRDGVPGVLREVGELELTLSVLGVGPDTSVVIVPAGTDSTEIGGATYIYWALKYLGHEAVAILDGGWPAWAADPANPIEAGPAQSPPLGDFVAAIRPELLVSTAEMAERYDDPDVVVIDARPADQYTGETQAPLVTRPGHIPGALSLDNAKFYDSAANRFRPTEALAALLPPEVSVPGKTLIPYCLTGHWSSINWFVLHELLGFEGTALYADSMAGWSRVKDLPLETGDGN